MLKTYARMLANLILIRQYFNEFKIKILYSNKTKKNTIPVEKYK